MKIIGTMRALEETRGAVRIEDTYDTDIDDLWEACTKPERLARWIAEVSGDLRLGGEFDASFTSGWEGTGRVDACEPPRRLLVTTTEAGEPDEQVIEVTLTPDGDRTKLIIEERGLPIDHLAAYGAGWQVHAEDLAAYLTSSERCDRQTRWQELIPFYRQIVVGEE
ncbi:MAG TPA: SRPBCC family protein [Nocardioidaceae bacterium]|nr:SRPBCC family protein [Nocardioidaceae bacterium]